MNKQYVALARVSSREQEREGFSLEVQEEALLRYAQQQSGEIAKLFRIAETATKPAERKTFRDLMQYTKKNAKKLAGVLFYKVDRAARNLFDYVELERLEEEFGVPVIYVAQPTENNPAGRMMRRTLANMASFYTEQQSLDVKEGLQRRVEAGLPVGKPPYGFRNVRRDGRSLIEVDPQDGPKIAKIFELYAYHGHTLDSLIACLEELGIVYRDSRVRFTRSKLHTILRDRFYIGDVQYKQQWHPGAHEPLVNRVTFDRVQVLLGEQIYQSHDLVYGSERITCGHCGAPITGEVKTKQTKKGPKRYIYYRCSKYNKSGHPRVRVKEADLDAAVLGLFSQLRIDDEKLRDWFAQVLRAKTQEGQRDSKQQIAELNRQVSQLRNQQDELLNLRLLQEIDPETFASKSQELRDRISALTLKIESVDRDRAETSELAEKVFELSQTLQNTWSNADIRAKRRLLDIVCLNFLLDDVNLVPTIRKPFDILAKGPSVLLSRADRI